MLQCDFWSGEQYHSEVWQADSSQHSSDYGQLSEYRFSEDAWHSSGSSYLPSALSEKSQSQQNEEKRISIVVRIISPVRCSFSLRFQLISSPVQNPSQA